MRLPAVLALLALAACRPGQQAEGYWDAVRLAATDEDRLAAARALAAVSTPEVAAQVLENAGGFERGEAGTMLLAIVAKHRPEGARWLVRRVLGKTLDEAFADVLDPDSLDDGTFESLDDPRLVGALATVLPDDPVAARWLTLLAVADRGDSTVRAREAVADDPAVRAIVLRTLEGGQLPRTLPTGLLAAFGAPRGPDEELVLRTRWAAAFEAALDVDSPDEFDGLRDAWTEAFPGEDPPVSKADLAIVDFVRHPPAPPSDDDDPDARPAFEGPEFAEAVAFFARHHQSGLVEVAHTYAMWDALPSNALSLVCRVSAEDCSELLGARFADPHPAAADVAPALDLPGGDQTLAAACDALEPAEARQLAARAAGAGMALPVRESAADCLAVLGDDATRLYAEVLDDAVRARNWDVANRLGNSFHEAVTEAQEAAALRALDAGEVEASAVENLLLDDDRALEIRRKIAEQRVLLPGRRAGRTRVIVLDDIIVD